MRSRSRSASTTPQGPPPSSGSSRGVSRTTRRRSWSRNQNQNEKPKKAVAPPDCPATGTVHTGYVFGQGFYGATRLSRLETTLTADRPEKSDPLNQRRQVGWKQFFKSMVLNPDFGFRFESQSGFLGA